MASGYPENVKTEDEKKKYIEDYKEHEGIDLDPTQIKYNPGLRSVSKLALNSLWGKFAQRENMRKSKYIHESEIDEFFQLLHDPSKKIVNFHILTNSTLFVDYEEIE